MPYKKTSDLLDYEELPMYQRKRSQEYYAKENEKNLKKAIGEDLYYYLERKLNKT